MNPVRVCLVGVGRAGMVHATNFKDNVPGASLSAIVDADLELAQARGKELGVDLVFSNIHRALEEAEIDAVCITTPTFTHAEIAIAAARAGVHIFCEKPMALTLQEADAMIEAADEAGVKLQIGFMRRFDPLFVTAKERIQGGEIGRPVVIRSLTRGPGLPPRWACDPRTSNGMLAEVNSHDFDTLRWLADSEFERIWAEANTLKCYDLKEEFPGFYDHAIVSLRLKNGTLGIIDGSCPVDYGYDARAEVLGSEGVILIGELQDRAVTTCTKQAGVVTSTFRSWRNRFREAYIAEACHFVECILQDRDPLVTGHDGRKAVEAVLAANESIQSGRPISLPLAGRAPTPDNPAAWEPPLLSFAPKTRLEGSFMRATVYHGINDLRTEEVEKPAVGEDEALLRVKAAAICGTDLRILASGHFKIPPGTTRILGHELAGQVVEVGSRVRGLVPGMRVAIAPNVGCGRCEECIQGLDHLCPNYEAFGISLDGAFAEYMRIPAAFIQRGNIVLIPEGISYEEAALNEPFSCCYHGSRACRIEPGDTVLIVGAGPIGIMHLLLARLSGASTVIVSEMIEERRLQALEWGADLAINPDREDLLAAVREVSRSRGADVVIVAAPAPSAQEQSLDLAATRGRINFFGGLPQGSEFIRFKSNRVHYKEITVTGTTGSSNYEFRRSMEIMASGQACTGRSERVALSRLISARFSLSEAKEAFTVAASKSALKVVINP